MARVDMQQTLENFGEAYRAGIVQTEPVRGNERILRHEDHPTGGTPRMTYVRTKGAHVTAVVVFAIGEPYEGLQCIQIGYAVREDQRGKGIAKELAMIALSDFTIHLANLGLHRFAIESTVDRNNPASKAVSMALLGTDPEEKDDNGVPVWHFIKIIEA